MPTYLPSKRFISLVVLLIGLLGLGILINSGVKYWKTRRIEEKKIADSTAPTIALGTLVDRDSDGDGVPDWEEPLWGTDPHKADTLGIGAGDKSVVEGKRAALTTKNVVQTGVADQNESDAFVSSFFTTFFALKNSGNLTPQNLQGVIDTAKTSIGDKKYLPDPYVKKQLTVIADTVKNKTSYRKSVAALLSSDAFASIDKANEALERSLSEQSFSSDDITYFAGLYTTLAERIARVPVPSAGVEADLALVNAYAKIGIALGNIAQVRENPLLGITGLAQYAEYTSKLTLVELAVRNYFNAY